MKIPKRWLKYKPIGQQIPETRFICFKTPLELSQPQLNSIKTDNQLTPDLLLKLVPNLGLIIDLAGNRRYDPKFFIEKGIEHSSIPVQGGILAPERKHDEFAKAVSTFLTQNNTKLIGVHCTHGLNRTGLLLCTYLVLNCKFSPCKALEHFETARGHKIERPNYKEAIYRVSITAPNIAKATSNLRLPLKDEVTRPDKLVKVPSNNLNASRSTVVHSRRDSRAATDVQIQESDSGSGQGMLGTWRVREGNITNPEGSSLNRDSDVGNSYRSESFHNRNHNSNNDNYGNRRSDNSQENYSRDGSRFGVERSRHHNGEANRGGRSAHRNNRDDRESKEDFIMSMKSWRSGDK